MGKNDAPPFGATTNTQSPMHYLSFQHTTSPALAQLRLFLLTMPATAPLNYHHDGAVFPPWWMHRGDLTTRFLVRENYPHNLEWAFKIGSCLKAQTILVATVVSPPHIVSI